MSRKEYQIKIKGGLDLSMLLGLGAEPLGQVMQNDIYLSGETTWRIREEGGQYIFAQKENDVGERAIVKDVSERIISKSEANRLMKERGILVTVFKKRVLFRFRESVIAVDDVEFLGEFTEIRSTSETSLFEILKILGFGEKEAFKQSYLDMMIARNLPGWLRSVLRFHKKIGELAFGITSGVLTTVGVLVGVNSATSSRLPVVAAVTAIAVADSCSDAFGMFMSKCAERGESKAVALRHAFMTLLGKFFLPLTFIVPIIFFPLNDGVWIDLIWGGIVLALLSAEQAVVNQKNPYKAVLTNVGLAVFIVILSYFAGSLVAKF